MLAKNTTRQIAQQRSTAEVRLEPLGFCRIRPMLADIEGEETWHRNAL